jgi:hypothetical protein
MSKINYKKKCVYCGTSTDLTREHVFPQFLDRIVFPDGKFSFIGGVNKTVIASPTIRDVCRRCNSGVLSQLDGYGKELSERYFKDFVVSKAVLFEYNYDLLLRWLLKVMYNAARAFKAPSSEFKPYVPYILGKTPKRPTTVLLAGIWKPSFYKGEIYRPRSIKVSCLIVPDESHSDLVLANMLSIQSYAFVVLGWGNEPTLRDLHRITESCSEEFGAFPLYKDNREVLLNPANSKLDYISHKLSQMYIYPQRIIANVKDAQRLVPRFKAIPVDALPELQYVIGKTALITLDDPKTAVFAFEKVHPGLVMKQVAFEYPDQALSNPRAAARIKRRGSKTYVDIIDFYELGAPFLRDVMGINQSDTNWLAWRNAIQENNGNLLIAILPSNLDYEQIEFVAKIRVIAIEG